MFTRRIAQLELEEELRELQLALAENPAKGRTDSGTGGLRKVRLSDAKRNKGKRSGARVHYLHLSAHAVIYLVFVYGKNEQDSLTPKQKRRVAEVAERIRAEWSVRPERAKTGNEERDL